VIPDITLVARAQRGDRAATEELVSRYRRRAERVALSFFLPGADRDDLRQEAVVGLLKATRTYRPDAGIPFASFFPLCVWRWLATCLRESQPGSRRLDLSYWLTTWG
jgi:RNA polymerase sporulation-specific sigma factor